MDSERDPRREVQAYLKAHNTVSLATLGPDGTWASTVFYVSLGFNLYFLSEPTTQHSRNLATNPTISATINEDYQDWREIKGIQMAASCQLLRGKVEAVRALAAYVKKYPFVGAFLQPGRLLEGMQIGGRPLNVHLYKIAPTRLFFINNARGFSHREEIPL